MSATSSDVIAGKAGYKHFLLLVAGLGGLFYGVDVGNIAGALPFFEAPAGLNGNNQSASA